MTNSYTLSSPSNWALDGKFELFSCVPVVAMELASGSMVRSRMASLFW